MNLNLKSKQMYHDIQLLQNSYLPVDKLISNMHKSFLKECRHGHCLKTNANKIIFHNYITLKMVQELKIKELVHNYITELLVNKENYGFLYFLKNEKLLIPLHVHFNSELVIDPVNAIEIEKEIRDMAAQISCPNDNNTFYDITLLEILYFLTILANPCFNWITVDYVLRGNRLHDYLIAAKDRIITKTWNTYNV